MGMAEVTLTLDNTDGWMPIDFNEVSVTRRALRSGDSEYLINGQGVRLSDVLDLFGKVARAVAEGNTAQAEQVMSEHRGLGGRCEALIDQLTDSGEHSVRDAVTLALSCRFLKRISAHLSNTLSSVVMPVDRLDFYKRSKAIESESESESDSA